MAQTDTQLQQLVINVGTEAQISSAISGGTITDDMLSITTDGSDITYDWVGTLAEYNTLNIATTHPNWLCFITDDVNSSGEDVYNNVYSKAEANDTFVAKVDNVPKYLPNLLEFKWSDCILNNTSWLRADTFSWQSGEIYEAVYQHLLADVTGKALQSETINDITIQYYEADDKHKICPASQESNILSLYSSTGVAWYYILDETNQKFKLPRTKFGFTGLRSTVGNYVAPGLPNITGDFFVGCVQYQSGNEMGGPVSGAFTRSNNNGVVGASWTAKGTTYNLNASRSSSIYGASSTVQSSATQMYLYFYVGEFTQDAIENTAGLNTELFNNKLETDLSNLSEATLTNLITNLNNNQKETIIGWFMPDFNSGQNISSGYVATKAGWVYWRGDTSTSNVLYIDNKIVAQTGSYADQMCQFVPLGKGQTLTYSRATTCVFYPCKK